MSADSDAVYALIKLSITQVDFQNNSIFIDSDAEYALIKTMRDQAVSTDSDLDSEYALIKMICNQAVLTDSDSDSEYALIEMTMSQAKFKKNSESVNSDANYWLTIIQKIEALCMNLSLYFRDSDEYYALISSSFIKQLKTRFITLSKLIKKVDDIYVEIHMIEVKCIALHSIVWSLNLSNDNWQAFIALYKQLLHEHYDFFIITDHSSANSWLRNLVANLSMSDRMWCHEIHFFLEILRNWLSESWDQMLTFVYFAYSMLMLLLEMSSAFKDTWVKSLEDLARYDIIVEKNIRVRENWTKVARN